MSPKP